MSASPRMRVVGAGLGRTGTNSLKLALEQLLGGPCYHMNEVIEHDEDVPVWHAAIRGEMPDWRAFPAGYAATVDWPACGFWRQLAAAHPDALVLLSTRRDADTWWGSFGTTIAAALSLPVPADRPDWQVRRAMTLDLMRTTLTPDFADADAARAAYKRHNAAVRAQVEPGRLVEWQPGDGWEPLCAALGVPVPGEPFPHTNAADEFRAEHVRSNPGAGLPPPE